MKISIKETARELDSNWDHLGEGIYNSSKFLHHLETYNFCNQKYYQLYSNDLLIVGAVVYSLKVNVLTFAKYTIKFPMRIIGVPASVDASGFVGDLTFQEELTEHIMKHEKGLVLCLNYNSSYRNKSFIQMETLPALIQEVKSTTWQAYLNSLRHPYRRRILKAEKKFENSTIVRDVCSSFTKEHYQQYLNIIKRTKTKLEILSFDFFSNLSKEFKLISSYDNDQLLAWHITVYDKETYYFLFGGINYELRNTYESYINNLILIIKDGIHVNSTSINLGQTAEITKKRFGAKPVKKKMFLYHNHYLIRIIFRLTKRFIGYNEKIEYANVYKM